jgi:hypothetical protein
LKPRVVLFVVLSGAAGAVVSCNAILGNVTLSAEDGGADGGAMPDGTKTDGTTDAQAHDVRSEADIGMDSPNLDSRFCANLRAGLAKSDAYVQFCDDFDPDGGQLDSFSGGFSASGNGTVAIITDVSCLYPPCLQASVPAWDGKGSLPQAFVVDPLNHDPSALPTYVACDLFVNPSCLGPDGSISVTRIELGSSGGVPSNVYFEARTHDFNLGWYRYMGHYGGPSDNPSGDVSFEAGAWARLWLEFMPLDGGSFQVTMAEGPAGSHDAPEASVPNAQGVFIPPPDGGIPNPSHGGVRFGLYLETSNTPACTILYDNVVVGPYAE